MGVKNLTTINGHLVDEVKEKPCIFEACLCGSLYSTFTTSFSLQFSSIIRLFHIILVEKKTIVRILLPICILKQTVTETLFKDQLE